MGNHIPQADPIGADVVGGGGDPAEVLEQGQTLVQVDGVLAVGTPAPPGYALGVGLMQATLLNPYHSRPLPSAQLRLLHELGGDGRGINVVIDHGPDELNEDRGGERS
jgi:hypothetical protein